MKLQGIFITPVFTMEVKEDYNLVEKLYDLKKRDSVGDNSYW